MEDSTPESQSSQGKSNTGRIIGFVLVLFLLLGGAGYFLSQSKKTSPSSGSSVNVTSEEVATNSTDTSNATQETGNTTQGAVKEFTLTAANFSFTPTKMTVKKGDTVKVTIKNSGGFHDFVIDEFNVKSATIPSGKSDTVTFTADKVGTFEFYCGMGNHRAMGMKGTLVVE